MPVYNQSQVYITLRNTFCQSCAIITMYRDIFVAMHQYFQILYHLIYSKDFGKLDATIPKLLVMWVNVTQGSCQKMDTAFTTGIHGITCPT